MFGASQEHDESLQLTDAFKLTFSQASVLHQIYSVQQIRF